MRRKFRHQCFTALLKPEITKIEEKVGYNVAFCSNDFNTGHESAVSAAQAR